MYLAEEAAKAAATTSNINTFDWFMLAFTVLIAIGLVRLLMVRPKKTFSQSDSRRYLLPCLHSPITL